MLVHGSGSPGATGYVGTVSLGLHLAESIVEAHSDQMWSSSEPGQGSTFCFSLPLTSGGSE